MKRAVLLSAATATIAIGAVWFLLFRSDAPPPVSLDDAVTLAATTTDRPDVGSTAREGPVQLDGTWTVNGANSFAGYRIGEELANFGTAEAVGRTDAVTGSLTVRDGVITAATVDVDMDSLHSDRSQRDSALRDRGLETATFPTASFVLTEPVAIGDQLTAGDGFSTTATGDLTLHGVTKTVELAVEGRVVDGRTVVAVGSLAVALADYAIDPPTGFAVLSIEDTGIIELQLEFTTT